MAIRMAASKRLSLEQVRSSLDRVAADVLPTSQPPSSTTASSSSVAGGSSEADSAESKKRAKKLKQKAKKAEAKLVAASLQSVADKESIIFEKVDPSWSKIREATCDSASAVSSGVSATTEEESQSMDGAFDGVFDLRETRDAIDDAIDRNLAVDPDWPGQESKVVRQLGRYKYSCHGDCEQNLPASKLLLMNNGEDWCGDVITYCQQRVAWQGSEKALPRS